MNLKDTSADLEHMAKAMIDAMMSNIQHTIPFDERIFTAQDAADYLRVSCRSFNDTLSKKAGFPAPFYLPRLTALEPTGRERDGARARWNAVDVRAWKNGLSG